MNLLLLPLIATLTVIKVSGLTGGMDAIVSTEDDDDSALDEALDFEARQVGVKWKGELWSCYKLQRVRRYVRLVYRDRMKDDDLAVGKG